MFKKNFPLVGVLFVFALLAACSSTTPNTASAASPATPTTPSTPPQQSQRPVQPQQQPPAPPEQHFTPNCAGCIQLNETDSVAIIRAQRAMMGLQTEWQETVKGMNDKFQAQQKIIADKLVEVRKTQKVPADYVFDYQNLQFAKPQPGATPPPAKK